MKNFSERMKGILESDIMEWTMLALAGLAVGMHLTYLLAVFEDGPSVRAFFILSIIIDSLFVIDFLLKIFILKMNYVKSPWFVVDLLAAIPIVSTLVEGIEFLKSLRTLRWLRSFRFFRALKALRALKSLRMLKFLYKMPDTLKRQMQFEKALKIGVIIFALIFLSTLTLIKTNKESAFVGEIESYLRGITNLSLIEEHELFVANEEVLGGDITEVVKVEVEREEGAAAYFFSTKEIEREMKMIEFYLLTGIIAGVFFSLMLSHFQHKDSTFQLAYQLLNVFLPETVINAFLEDQESFYRQVHDKATIMFIDIAGFTKSFEKYRSDPVYLNDNLTAVLDVIVDSMERHDLIVDKIIGDAVLSFRGGPLVEGSESENALRVIRAAIEAMKEVSELGNPVFNRIKVGIASGYCLIGAGGSSKRLSYTVLGDVVNLAARLEPASGKLAASNLIDESTYELVKDELKKVFSFRFVGVMSVSGKEETVRVYEILPLQENSEWIKFYEDGVYQRSLQQWEKAVNALKTAHESRPGGDPVSLNLIKNCEELMESGSCGDWRGTLDYVKG